MDQNYEKEYRTINFDLDTKKIKELGCSRQKIYDNIKKFLTTHGFKHRQWSGYISKEPITQSKLRHTIIELGVKYPILAEVTREFDITVVKNELSVIDYIKDGAKRSKSINLPKKQLDLDKIRKRESKDKKDIMERALDMLINDNKKDNPIAKRTKKKEDCLER